NARPGSPGGDLAMRIRTLSGDRGQAQELHWPPGWQERPTLAMLARGATLAINAGAASIWLVLRGGAELEGREGRFALDAGQWLYLDRESMPSVRAGARALVLGLVLPRSEEHTSELQSRENLVCR